MSNRGLDVLSAETCEQLLRGADFGRVVTKIGDTMSAFPVYYAMSDRDIVFRTDPGTKLDAAVLHTRVTFEVDDEAGGWSVMVFGVCEEVRDAAQRSAAMASLGDHWTEGERLRVVRIRPERLSGRRLRAAEGGGPLPEDAH
jgi:nitroimidazol reductase NimA-like FMN-containing flavoprotein (pyridoxamine 5'-phosphate oxidase superfamily)